jgi:hypothetical protein
LKPLKIGEDEVEFQTDYTNMDQEEIFYPILYDMRRKSEYIL